jgi:hypothetical protein
MRTGLAIVVACAALGGCSLSQDASAASSAVANFHRQLNAGQFDAIYAASSPTFKASTTELRFTALLAAVHRKLGALRSATVSGWRVNATTGGTFASLSVSSTFANGPAQETFEFQTIGGRQALQSYQINAEALILN